MSDEPIILTGQENFPVYEYLELGIPDGESHGIAYYKMDDEIIITAHVGSNSIVLEDKKSGTLIITHNFGERSISSKSRPAYKRTLTIQRLYEGSPPELSQSSTATSVLTIFFGLSDTGVKNEPIDNMYSLIRHWHEVTNSVLHELEPRLPKPSNTSVVNPEIKAAPQPEASLNTNTEAQQTFTGMLQSLFISCWRRISGHPAKEADRPLPPAIDSTRHTPPPPDC